jgi:hypothetical protein
VSLLNTTPLQCFHSYQQQSKIKVEAEPAGIGEYVVDGKVSVEGGPNRGPEAMRKGQPMTR